MPSEDLTGDDPRARLVALRDILADAIASTGARDLPALTARYLEVTAKLDALPDDRKEPTLAERIANRSPRRR